MRDRLGPGADQLAVLSVGDRYCGAAVEDVGEEAWCPRCSVLHDGDGGGKAAGLSGGHFGQDGNTPGGCPHDHEAKRILRDCLRIAFLLVSHGPPPILFRATFPFRMRAACRCLREKTSSKRATNIIVYIL